MSYYTDVNALKKLMIDQDVKNITDLSKRTGVGRDTLSKILSGKAQPSSLVMGKLIDGLSIPPGDAGAIFFIPDLRNT